MHLFQFRRWSGATGPISKLVITLLMVGLAIVLISTRLPLDKVSLLSPNALSKPATLPPQAEQVEVGIFAVNIYDVEITSNSFYADFYVWFKWKGDIDPITYLEVSNSISDWAMMSVPAHPEPERLPDGRYYQISRLEGRFLQSFDLKRYPLDEHDLSIFMENSVYTTDKLVYVADHDQSGRSDFLAIPGWSIDGTEISSLVRTYDTNFGDSRLSGQTQHSVLRYSIHISRPWSFFSWKLLLPLVIVLASSWGALLLAPTLVDSRVALPVTALLTAVFLQETYSDALPDLGYLVLMDKVYVIAYILIFTSILEVIITAYWISQDEEKLTLRVMWVDVILLGIQVLVITIGLAWLVFWS
jgi:hypothetical protein